MNGWISCRGVSSGCRHPVLADARPPIRGADCADDCSPLIQGGIAIRLSRVETTSGRDLTSPGHAGTVSFVEVDGHTMKKCKRPTEICVVKIEPRPSTERRCRCPCGLHVKLVLALGSRFGCTDTTPMPPAHSHACLPSKLQNTLSLYTVAGLLVRRRSQLCRCLVCLLLVRVQLDATTRQRFHQGATTSAQDPR